MSSPLRRCPVLRETIYRARSANDSAKKVLIGLSVSALAFVAAAYITPALSGIVWLIAFVFIVASLFVYNKYVGAEYCYEITEYGTPALVISQTVGKTSKTMARIDLDSISEIKRMTGDEYRKYRVEKGVTRYTYHPTMLPSEIYLITMRSDYENADVFIEASDAFVLTLQRTVEAFRAQIDPYAE